MRGHAPTVLKLRQHDNTNLLQFECDRPIQKDRLSQTTVPVQIYNVITTAQLYALLDARRKELGLSHRQLGQKAFGREDNSALSNMQRGSSPTWERLSEICHALGLEVNVVGSGGSPDGMAETAGDYEGTEHGNGTRFLSIPWLAPGSGAGSAPVALSPEWIRANALIPDRLSAVKPDSSMVDWIDASKTIAVLEAQAPRRGAGHVWAFEDAGKIVIGRLAFLPDALVVMPRSLDEAPQVHKIGDVTAVRPLGRVVCLAQMTGG